MIVRVLGAIIGIVGYIYLGNKFGIGVPNAIMALIVSFAIWTYDE